MSGSAADLTAAFAGTVTTHTGTVTVTDAATLAQLVAINNATTGAITLNSTSTALAGTSADLVAAFSGTITAYTGALTATDGGTNAQVEAILSATTGVANVRLTNTETGGTFTAAQGDVINIDPAGTTADLSTEVLTNAGDVDADGEWHFASGVFTWREGGATDSITLTGIAAVNLAANTVTVASNTLTLVDNGGGAFTLSGGGGNITLTEAAGLYTFTPATGTAATGITASSVTALTIPAGRQLVSTAGVLTGNAIVTLTGDVTVTDTSLTATALNAIDTATTGTVTATAATALSGTAAAVNLAAQSAGITNAPDYNTTLDAGVALATDLTGITSDSGSGTVNATAVTAINGSAAQVKAVVDAADITTAAGYSSTVSDGDADEAVMNAILGDTTGIVTASLSATAAALNAALTNASASDALTFTLAAGSAAAADLSGLDAKTSVALAAGPISTITGSAAQVKVVYDAQTDGTTTGISGSINLTLNDVDADEAALNTLLGATTGTVTATLAGVAATLNGALTNGAATDALTITLDAGTAAATDLTGLDSKTSVAVVASSITAINGTAAEVKAVVDAGGITTAANYTATISDSDADTALLNAILGDTTGVVTATLDGTAADLNSGLVNGASGDALTLTLDPGSAAATDLTGLDGKTSVVLNVAPITTITGSVAQIQAVYDAQTGTTISNVSASVNLTANDVDAAEAGINTLLGATTGTVTANLTGDAATLNAALGNSTATDALTITFTAGAAAATDLTGLDGKTSVAVVATAVTGINGTAAEVKAAIDAAGITTSSTYTSTVSDADADETVLNAILGDTSGIVTASLSGSAGTLNAALTNAAATDALTITLAAEAVAATDLTALDGKTSVAVNAGAVTAINGTIAAVKAVVDATGITKPGNYNVTLAAGAGAAADISAIVTAGGTGTVDGALVTGIDGTVAAVLQALTDLDTDPATFNSTLTGIAAATAISSLDGLNGSGTITGTGITEINGTASAVVTALGDIDVDPTAFNSTLTGTASLADINTIDTATSGTLTLTGITTLQITASGSIAGLNSGNAIGTTLDLTTAATAINATMTATQHNGYTTAINAAGGDDTITLTTSGTIATDEDIGTYSVAAGSTVTVGTNAGHLAQVLTETGSGVTTFTLGSGTYTGVWTSIETDDVVKVVDGTNVAANTGLNGGVKFDLQDTGGTITMTEAQHDASTFINTAGTQTIAISGELISIDGAIGIEAYTVLDDGADNAIVNALAGQSVTGTHTTDLVVFSLGGNVFTGTFTGDNTVQDVIVSTGSNIAGATINGITKLTVSPGSSVTLTAAQYGDFTTFAGDAAETVTFTTALAGAATLQDVYESFVFAAGANSVTSGKHGQALNATALLDGEVLTLAAAHNVTVSLVAGDLAASSSGNVTVNATTGSNVITTGDGSDTITGGTGADSLTGGNGADTFVFASGASGLSEAAADQVLDFSTGVDVLKLGIAGAGQAEADAAGLNVFGVFIDSANDAFAGGAQVYVGHNYNNSGKDYVFVDYDDSGLFDNNDVLIIVTGTVALSDIVA